jgi:hypothetical protein
MLTRVTRALILVLAAAGAMQADIATLVDTIPTNPFSLFPQPPLLTGAAPVFGGAVVVGSSPFTAPVSADLNQISVVVMYEFFPSLGVTGMSPMLLTLSMNSGNSPGTPFESWIVPLNPPNTSSPIVTVDSLDHPLLAAGQEYWLSVVPTDPIDTGIGWGLTLSGSTEFSVSGTTAPEPSTLWICALIFFHFLLNDDYFRPRQKTTSEWQYGFSMFLAARRVPSGLGEHHFPGPSFFRAARNCDGS